MDSSPKTGSELRSWRLTNGITQRTAGNIVGADQRTVSVWEATNQTLHRIARERLAEFMQNPSFRAPHKLPRANSSRRVMVDGKPYTPRSDIQYGDDGLHAFQVVPDALDRFETMAQYRARKGL